jgi:transcriptional regulator with XRE-family HTH domain
MKAARKTRRGQSPLRKPNAVDAHVGSRLRQIRTLRGTSQEQLAEMLGLTFQQVQKYEKGTNRIGASRLQQISIILQVPVAFFFEGAPGPDGLAEGASPEYVTDFLSSSDGLNLVKAFTRIPNAALRRRVVDLVEEMADEADKRT